MRKIENENVAWLISLPDSSRITQSFGYYLNGHVLSSGKQSPMNTKRLCCSRSRSLLLKGSDD